MANRLANESSPYLLQHADNPVDWYPWGEEALARARAEGKPIFLSIGYSTCHWCHRMAHESFEDEGIARFLNAHFICIKVDREERPDLDQIYMAAVQAMTGSGGWPMTLFLTPEGNPFYAGTYFPRETQQGMPAFLDVLQAVNQAWERRRDELQRKGQRVVNAIVSQQNVPSEAGEADFNPEILEAAYRKLAATFDSANGGWGGAPKFPHPATLEFLLRYHYTTGARQPLEIVVRALEAMARGGIYDQLGGGFHRYAVDPAWQIPHFEKMLYDNALLARVYLHAWQVTGIPLFRAVVEEVLDYGAREMLSPEGGFYAAQDADTEGQEGKFFVWAPEEIRTILGEDAEMWMTLYGVTEAGNFEGGTTVLSFLGTWEEREALRKLRARLFEARAQRVHPGRDEKVVTSWNGLMLAAYAEAGAVLEREDYLEIAGRNADFLLTALRTPEGRLWHTWKAGEARVPGFLEDYAALGGGLLALYRATFDLRWYTAAQELAEVIPAHFAAATRFYDTADDAEALVVRPREIQDHAVPSGNALTVMLFLELGLLAGQPRYSRMAQTALKGVLPLLEEYPLAFSQWLNGLDTVFSRPTIVAIAGSPTALDTQALAAVARRGYHPHRYLVAGETDRMPLLKARHRVGGAATAYVCIGTTCQPEVTDPQALHRLLE